MVEDLKRNYLKKGMAKTDILNLLGTCDFPENPTFFNAKNLLLYKIGSSGLDACYLYIYIDENEKLRETNVDCS